MNELPAFFTVVAALYLWAALALPLLRRRGGSGVLLSGFATSVMFLFPLAIPASRIGLRSLALVICTDAVFKMWDTARRLRSGDIVISRDEYLRLLIPFPIFLVTLSQRRRLGAGLSPRVMDREVVRALAGGAGFAGCWALLYPLSEIELLRENFALDHGIKLALFVAALESAAQMVWGLERLAGWNAQPPMQRQFLARTVAEFWRRYNCRVHTWLSENVFRPTGGRRRPVRGVMAAFFVSAVHHELAFGIATSRWDGYQFAFFMLQAPMALLSPRLERFARTSGVGGKALAHALTITWFYFTSMLFLHGANRVFPMIYAGDSWLP